MKSLDARLRRRTARTRTGSARTTPPHRAARDRGRAIAARGRGLRARLRRRQPARDRHAAAVLERARRRHRHAALARRCGCRSCPRSSASTRASSSCTRTTSSARSCSCSTHDVPGIYNVAGDGLLPWSEVAAICGKRRVPLPPVLTGAGGRAAAAAAVVDLPPELLDLLRYGRGVDNRRVQARRLRLPATRPPARSRPSPQACGSRGTVGDSDPDVPVRARRREVLPPLPRRRARPTG